jgi:uncharacterized membrane-anchored protein
MYSKRIVCRFGTHSRYNFRGIEWHQNRYVNRTLICVYINSTHNRFLNRQVQPAMRTLLSLNNRTHS